MKYFYITFFIITLFSSKTNAKIYISSDRSKIESSIFGWINTDLGLSDTVGRYSGTSGKDRIGVSQLAIGAEAKADNIKLVSVVAGDNLSNGNGNGPNISIKDAFINVSEIFGSDFNFSIGAQPFLFGLKPNGYPGDRSLQSSIEFGATNVFNVSQQDGTSAILSYKRKDLNISFGTFDQQSTHSNSGTSLDDNFFLTLRTTDISLDGFYLIDFKKLNLAAGYEKRYINSIHGARAIYFIGGEFNHKYFMISFEYVSLDKEFNSTVNDDVYHIAELTFNITEKTKVYVDYSTSRELKNSTYRFGAVGQIHANVSAQIEISKEKLHYVSNKPSSLDLRLQFAY